MLRIFFLKALQLKPNNPSSIYNIACIESLLGNIEEAVSVLKLSIEAGYDNLSHMLEDSDLDNIRHTEGFDECVLFLSKEVTSDDVVPDELTPEIEEKIQEHDELKSIPLVRLIQPIQEHDELKSIPLVRLIQPITTPVEQPTEQSTTVETEQPTEHPIEEEDLVSLLLKTLGDMGITLDEEKANYYIGRFGSDFTQIVDHYFRTLTF